MSKLGDASRNWVMLGNMLRPILDAVPDLERIGNLESYEAELKDRVAILEKAEDDGKVAVAKNRDQIVADRNAAAEKAKEAEADLERKKAAADAHVAHQQAVAKATADAAARDAAQIIAKARTDAAAIAAAAAAAVGKISTEAAAAASKLATLKADIAKHEGALQELKKKLAPALNG